MMASLLPSLAFTLPEKGKLLDIKNLLPSKQEIWLEIGFGGGEHMAAQASAHRNIGFIGCEPYINGIANLMVQIEKAGLENMRIYQDDARHVIMALPDASIQRVFLLFPDPWPKLRHYKRRIISRSFVEDLARIISPGGRLRLTTDHEDYGQWMLEHILSSSYFQWTAQCAKDWRFPPSDWIETRYEIKARKQGKHILYLDCIRT